MYVGTVVKITLREDTIEFIRVSQKGLILTIYYFRLITELKLIMLKISPDDAHRE